MKTYSPKSIIVDIDNTITSNVLRKYHIMRHILGLNVTVEMVQRDYGLTSVLPATLEAQFFSLFNEPQMLDYDSVIDGSVAALTRFRDMGLQIIYLSGRPCSLRLRTLEVFERLGFPLPDGRDVRLFLKHSSRVSDKEFKDSVLFHACIAFHVVAGIGDLPADVQLYSKHGFDAIGFVNQFSREEILADCVSNCVAFDNWPAIEAFVLRHYCADNYSSSSCGLTYTITHLYL